MSRTLIWVLSFTVLGPVPESGEQAKFKTQEDCELARVQKREEYQAQKKRIVATCYVSSEYQRLTTIKNKYILLVIAV